MKILQINKFYPFEGLEKTKRESDLPYSYGGAETVMLSISRLLRERGHEVFFFSMQHPKGLRSQYSDYFVPYMNMQGSPGPAEQIKIAGRILYSREARKRLATFLDRHSVDIVHLHNIQHQISPSILHELKKRRIPAVMSLNDYKMVCPSYGMLNHGKVCELCKGGKFYNCTRTRCHKNSYGKSLLVTMESYLHHDILKSYRDIKCYICPSMFIVNKVREMGLKGNFSYLPHFVYADEWKPSGAEKADYVVYCGRLSGEKGIKTLIKAVKEERVPVKIIGDGPLETDIRNYISNNKLANIELSGYLDKRRLKEQIEKSRFLIMPSEGYEVFGMVIIESFALGVPVIASKSGGIGEIVKDGETGLLFKPGDTDDLRSKIRFLLSDPARVAVMGQNARRLAENKYNPGLYYERLMEVYNNAIMLKNEVLKR